jgi:hypothetical protein
LALTLSTQVAHAQSIEICRTSGSGSSCTGYATIQDAVDAATWRDVITIDNGEYEARNVVIRKSLTIRGATPRGTILQAGTQPCEWTDRSPIETGRVATETERIFDIQNGIVVLEDLTLRNGCARYDAATGYAQGGGIKNWGDLTLRRVIMERNVAWIDPKTEATKVVSPTFGAQGGAIYNNGVLRVDSSTFITNAAGGIVGEFFGGGIYNGLSANIINSTISGNRAQDLNDSLPGRGGGIFSKGVFFNAEYNSIIANYAVTEGGGIAVHGAGKFANNLFDNNISLTGSACTQRTEGTAQGADDLPPNCDVPLPPVTVKGITTDTIVPVFLPDVGVTTQSESLNYADCDLSNVKTDQLGSPRGFDGKCDLGAVEAGMSFMPFVDGGEALPDLRVRKVTLQPAGEITAATLVTVAVEIENIGKLSTAERFFVTLYINPKQAPPNRAGISWPELCRNPECTNEQGVVWAAPANITPNGGTYTLITDMNDATIVVKPSSNFTSRLPEGPVDMWVYVDSFSTDRSPNGLIRESEETNNLYRVGTIIVKPGRIVPGAAADQTSTQSLMLPTMEP